MFVCLQTGDSIFRNYCFYYKKITKINIVAIICYVPYNSIWMRQINTPTSRWTNFCNPENADRSFRRHVGMNLQLFARHSPEQCPMNHPFRDDLKPYNISFFYYIQHPKYISERLCLPLANGPYVLHFSLRSLCRPGTLVLCATVH